MKLSLRPQHLRRYKEIARFVFKYGRSDLARRFGTEAGLTDEELNALVESGKADELVDDLERMGPTFVKLGQVLSSRPDLLPPPYLKALERLQDRVKPFPYAEVEQIVQAELGARISKAFAEFDRTPAAAASLGQVHRAVLRNGRPVVVKIQRPGVRKLILEDLEVLEEVATFLESHTELGRRYQLISVFEQARHTLLHELDYQREAANLTALANNLAEMPRIYVPRPVRDYTTRSVLTMDWVQGVKITEMSPLARLDMDGAALAEELFKAYLKQVLVDGLFHADPHPGNVFLTSDKRVALLDLGMIGHTSPAMQEKLLKLLLAVSDGNSDDAADVLLQMSETASSFKENVFRHKAGQLVAEHHNNNLEQIRAGATLLDLARSASETGLYVPSELTLLGKTLLQLDEIGRCLDPHFTPNAAVRRNLLEILNRRVWRSITPAGLVSSVLELKDFVSHLPSRVTRILDAVAHAKLEVKVRATDVSELLDSLQQVANRITAGLVLASLIVGAALLMQVETEFKLFGLPGLGMIFFLIAAMGGFYLVFNILVRDRQKRKKFK